MLSRDIWESLATRFMVFGLGAVGSILLTRALGPEGRGLYLGVVSLVALGTQFGTLGMGASNTFYLSGGKEDGKALASNALVLGLTMGSLLALIGWGAASRIHGLRTGVGDSALVVGLATIPLSLLLVFGQNLLIAKGEVRKFNQVEIIRNLGWMVLVVVFAVLMGFGHRAAIWLNFGTFGLANLWIWTRLERDLAPRLSWNQPVFRRTMGYGLKAYLVNLFGYLVLRLDALLVLHWRGATEGGQYGVAVQLGDLLLTVTSTVGMVIFPTLVERGPEAWSTVRRISLAIGGGLAGISLLAYILAPWGIKLIFGPAFLPSVSAFRILLPGIWFLSMETLLAQYLAALGLPFALLWCWLGALILNLALNAFLIPRMGISGAAWASTAAYFFMALLVTALVVKDRRSRMENCP